MKLKTTPAFQIETTKYGTVEFSEIAIWRHKLIDKYLKNVKSMQAKDVVVGLSKCTVLKIIDTIFDFERYENNPEIFDNIDLELNDDELHEFAVKFSESNDYLFGKSSGKVKVGFGEGPFLPIPDDKDLINRNWPDDIYEKIKEAWLLHDDKQKQWADRILGITGLSSNFGLASVISKQNKIFSKYFNYNTPSVAGSSIIKEKLNTPDLKISQLLHQEAEIKGKINASIIQAPVLLNKLIELQKEIYISNLETTKLTNMYLEEQIVLAKSSSSSAKIYAILALMVASVSVIISTVFGIIEYKGGNEFDETVKSINYNIDKNKVDLSKIEKELFEIKNGINKNNKIITNKK